MLMALVMLAGMVAVAVDLPVALVAALMLPVVVEDRQVLVLVGVMPAQPVTMLPVVEA